MSPDELAEALRLEKPHAGVTCPVCGRIYEEPIEIEGRRIRGHVQGSPECKGARGERAPFVRDARARKAARAGVR